MTMEDQTTNLRGLTWTLHVSYSYTVSYLYVTSVTRQLDVLSALQTSLLRSGDEPVIPAHKCGLNGLEQREHLSVLVFAERTV